MHQIRSERFWCLITLADERSRKSGVSLTLADSHLYIRNFNLKVGTSEASRERNKSAYLQIKNAEGFIKKGRRFTVYTLCAEPRDVIYWFEHEKVSE